MSASRRLSRRAVLSGASFAAVTVAGAAVDAPAGATPVPRGSGTSAASRLTSHNGWTLESQADTESTVWTRPVSGTAMEVPVRLGVAEALLVHVARRVHYEIEPLGPSDLEGWRPLGRTSRRSPASNLASGTAIRIRPGARSDAYFPFQLTVLRDILSDADGVVRWGGDDADRDESLFYLDRGPEDPALGEVGRRLRVAAETPGDGAGVMIDPLLPRRRSHAEAIARRQGVA